MFSSLQSLDLLMPTGFFFHWPRLLSKYELRIVRVPFTVILNDAWLDRKFHFSCIVIVDIKFQNNYCWKVSGLIMWMPGSEPLVNTMQRECVRIPEVWLHTIILRQLFCSNNDVHPGGRSVVEWSSEVSWPVSWCGTRFEMSHLIQEMAIRDAFLITATIKTSCDFTLLQGFWKQTCRFCSCTLI